MYCDLETNIIRLSIWPYKSLTYVLMDNFYPCFCLFLGEIELPEMVEIVETLYELEGVSKVRFVSMLCTV